MLKKTYMPSWNPVFDGDDDKDKDKNKNTPTTFTQDQVNEILAKAKRDHKEAMDNIHRELNALKTRSDLTAEERQQLEQRVERLKAENLTKEEQLTRQLESSKREAKEEAERLQAERDNYKSLFTKHRINSAIAEAASANKAYRADQIRAILSPDTALVETVDESGSPTGEFVPEVTYRTVDKDKKPISLKLSVPDAVARMREDDAYANLFMDTGTGGTGGRNQSTKEEDWKAIYSDPERYRKAKEEGKIA